MRRRTREMPHFPGSLRQGSRETRRCPGCTRHPLGKRDSTLGLRESEVEKCSVAQGRRDSEVGKCSVAQGQRDRGVAKCAVSQGLGDREVEECAVSQGRRDKSASRQKRKPLPGIRKRRARYTLRTNCNSWREIATDSDGRNGMSKQVSWSGLLLIGALFLSGAAGAVEPQASLAPAPSAGGCLQSTPANAGDLPGSFLDAGGREGDHGVRPRLRGDRAGDGPELPGEDGRRFLRLYRGILLHRSDADLSAPQRPVRLHPPLSSAPETPPDTSHRAAGRLPCGARLSGGRDQQRQLLGQPEFA